MGAVFGNGVDGCGAEEDEAFYFAVLTDSFEQVGGAVDVNFDSAMRLSLAVRGAESCDVEDVGDGVSF